MDITDIEFYGNYYHKESGKHCKALWKRERDGAVKIAFLNEEGAPDGSTDFCMPGDLEPARVFAEEE